MRKILLVLVLASIFAAAGCTIYEFHVDSGRHYAVSESNFSGAKLGLTVDKGDESSVIPSTSVQSIDTQKVAEAISGSIVEILKKFLESYLK